MTSSPYGPYELGYTRATMAITKSYTKFLSKSLKIVVSGLYTATRIHEVGITSNRRPACYGEIVPRPCTHRPSHAGREFYLKICIINLIFIFHFLFIFKNLILLIYFKVFNQDEVVTR